MELVVLVLDSSYFWLAMGRGVHRGRAVLAGLVASLVASTAFADTVVLKNGTRYEGLIKAQSADEVTILSDGADWTFHSDKVASVSKDAVSARIAAREAAAHARALADDAPHVILYATSWCSVCRRARQYLHDNHIRFIDNDIEVDARANAEMRQKCALNHLKVGAVPVIDVRGHVMVGFSEAFIRRHLKKHG